MQICWKTQVLKVKQSLYKGFQEVEAPRFQDSQHMKVVRLSAVCTGRLYPTGNFLISVTGWMSWPLGHSEARNIISKKNSKYTAEDRTCNLLACRAVPEPSVGPCVPVEKYKLHYITVHIFLDAGNYIIPVLILHIMSILTYSRSGGTSGSF